MYRDFCINLSLNYDFMFYFCYFSLRVFFSLHTLMLICLFKHSSLKPLSCINSNEFQQFCRYGVDKQKGIIVKKSEQNK